MADVLIICIVFFGASVVTGITGFGLSLMAGPVLFFFLEPQVVVPICAMAGTFSQAFILRACNREVSLKSQYPLLIPLLLGGIPGLFVGEYALLHLPTPALSKLIGIFLTVYGLWSLLGKKPRNETPLEPRPQWGAVAGFLSTTISSAFSGGGPPVVIYVMLLHLNRRTSKTVLSAFFFAMCLAQVLLEAVDGLITLEVLRFSAFTLLGVVLGARLGLHLSRNMGESDYTKLLGGFLTCVGLLLMCRAWGIFGWK